jgi:hypothetical protein
MLLKRRRRAMLVLSHSGCILRLDTRGIDGQHKEAERITAD